MTEKEFRKLSRAELLEMLIAQTKESERLRQELASAQHQLEERRIVMNDAGSIAQASLRLNGVFEAAQAAADEYVSNIRLQNIRQDVDYFQAKAKVEEETYQLLAQTQRRCRRMEQRTLEKCNAMIKDAQKEVQRCREMAFFQIDTKDPRAD